MSTRLGTPYAHKVAPTNTYQALAGDDIIIPVISSGKTITLPAISSLGPDDKEKIVGNDSTSVGNATFAAASGDSIGGLAVFLPGQNARVVVQGRTWESFGGVVDSGTGTTATSTADSKGVSGGTAASVADSKAVSNSLNASVADSKGVSSGTSASIARSKLTSAGY